MQSWKRYSIFQCYRYKSFIHTSAIFILNINMHHVIFCKLMFGQKKTVLQPVPPIQIKCKSVTNEKKKQEKNCICTKKQPLGLGLYSKL